MGPLIVTTAPKTPLSSSRNNITTQNQAAWSAARPTSTPVRRPQAATQLPTTVLAVCVPAAPQPPVCTRSMRTPSRTTSITTRTLTPHIFPTRLTSPYRRRTSTTCPASNALPLTPQLSRPLSAARPATCPRRTRTLPVVRLAPIPLPPGCRCPCAHTSPGMHARAERRPWVEGDEFKRHGAGRELGGMR